MTIIVELDSSGKKILINAEWRYKELCKSIPGAKWDPKENYWHLPLSWSGCLALRSTFKSDLEIGPNLTQWAVNEKTGRIDPANFLREVTEQMDGDQDLFPHQRAGVNFLSTARRALLADEPGLGKTAQAIRALKRLKDGGEDIFPALVVCPNTLKKNWEREFALWWPGVRVQVVSGTSAQRKKQFAPFTQEDVEASDVLVINWESLRTHSRLAPYGSVALARCVECGGMNEKVTPGRCEVHKRELNEIDFKAVVADECFASGVKVETPSGEVSIEDIKVGDLVVGYDHTTQSLQTSRVLATMNRQSSHVVDLFQATPNHPYYVVGSGYRQLGDLCGSDQLIKYDAFGLRSVQFSELKQDKKNLRRKDLHNFSKTSNSAGGRWEELSDVSASSTQSELDVLLRGMQTVLYFGEDSEEGQESPREGLRILQPKIYGRKAKKILQSFLLKQMGTSASWEVRTEQGNYGEASHNSQGRDSIVSTQRKKSFSTTDNRATLRNWQKELDGQRNWSALDESYAVSEVSIRSYKNDHRVQAGVPSTNGGRSESSVLRAGYQHLGHKDSSRGGWLGAPWTQGVRRAPNSETGIVGVDSHSVLELRDNARFGGVLAESSLSSQVTVYSLTTETGNYFADSVLVKNCHRSKDPKSKQTRALWSATGDADIRYALTGTPIANDVVDLWTILHWLSPEEWPSKTRWIDRMVDTMLNAFGGLMVLGIKSHMREEFYATLNPRMRRMLKTVVLPWLPEVTVERRDVDMSAKQKKAYNEMRDWMIAELETGGVVSAPSVLTQTLRLLQFASSYAEMTADPSTGEMKATLIEPSCKIDALMDDISHGDFGSDSIAVSAVSRQLIELLSARLTRAGIAHGLITGAQNEDERQRAVDDFQAGRTKWILFTAQAGGVGITLTAARRLIRLQRPWSLVDDKQVNDRVHRIGSEIHDNIIITDYVTSGTVEERVREVLESKAESFEEVVKDKEQLLKMLKEEKGS